MTITTDPHSSPLSTNQDDPPLEKWIHQKANWFLQPMLRLSRTLRLREHSKDGLFQTLQQYTQTAACTHTCRVQLSPLVTKSLTELPHSVLRHPQPFLDDPPQRRSPRERQNTNLSEDTRAPGTQAPELEASALGEPSRSSASHKLRDSTGTLTRSCPRHLKQVITVLHFVNRGTSLPGQDKASRRDRGFQKLSGPKASPSQGPEVEGSIPSPARAQSVQPLSCWRTGGESTAMGQGRGRCDRVCARARGIEYVVECACVHVCVPGGRRQVLAASLGTYKSCGRICLRCQLKAFSNVYPTPSPGTGEVRGLRNPICLLLASPTAWPEGTHSWSLHHPLSWPSLSPGGPKADGREGRSCLTSPLPGERPKIRSLPGYHFATAAETATKWGSPGGAWAGLAPVPCT